MPVMRAMAIDGLAPSAASWLEREAGHQSAPAMARRSEQFRIAWIPSACNLVEGVGERNAPLAAPDSEEPSVEW